VTRSATDLVIAIPALGRPHLIEPVYRSARRATPAARVVFGCTSTDEQVLGEVDRLGVERLLLAPRSVGDYAAKINAIFRATTEPLLFTGATDILFHPGWFDRALARLTPGGVGVVGTNDLGSPRVKAGEHSTHSLVVRDYIDRYGGTADGPGHGVLWEGYVHEYVDDELVGVARHRGAYAHAGDAYVEHRHPDWDSSVPRDALYDSQRDRMRRSLLEFRRRRRRWT
jgi:hypothetical protein